MGKRIQNRANRRLEAAKQLRQADIKAGANPLSRKEPGSKKYW